jgi:hypothetical protein
MAQAVDFALWRGRFRLRSSTFAAFSASCQDDEWRQRAIAADP